MRPWLAAHEPRCRPGGTRRETCGRAMAALPERGAIVVDYAQTLGCEACPHFLPVSKCVAPPNVVRRVFKGIGEQQE